MPPRTRALLSFAEKAAADPTKVDRADVAALRSHGFEDEGVFDAVAVVALFAFFTTVADALGIDDEPEWGSA